MDVEIYPGDLVRLRLAKEEISGTVLESLDSDVILLKLKSGYNVGVPKEKVLGGKVLRRFKSEKTKQDVKYLKDAPTIGLVVTGGTIASKVDGKTGAVSPLTKIEEFARVYPELFSNVNVKTEIPFMLDSSCMNAEHWKEIARACEKLLNDKEVRGVIVTHGTDTLHYTASALSFFLRNLGKPVVLTYSQRSIDRGSSDAHLNLECSVRMALSNCAEVMLVGHASSNDDFCHAMSGTKVRKMHSSRRDAFKTINAGPIAKVWPDRIDFFREYRTRNDRKLVEVDGVFNDKVGLLKIYPGQDPSILDYYALKYKGLVLELFGLGQLPASEAKETWIPKLKKHIRSGLIVCGTVQTLHGRLNPKVYSIGREVMDSGVIFLEDMLPETAYIKLGWILGHRGWKGKVREKMLENYSGELSKFISY